MHIPDGFIDAGTSAGAGVVAAAGVAVCLKKAADTMQEKQVAMAGLVSAFIFAVQMLNFPVASGTSGHLLGGLLAAVLVGPWVGALCVSVVLFVQALVFADGGLSALGLNVVNMALVTALGGYAVFRVLRWLLPRTKSSVVVASGIAGFLSVVLASLAFTLEYAAGGAGGVSLSTVFGAMVSVHVLIGVGEGIITAATVAVVLAVRPDVVYGASDLEPELELRTGLVTNSRTSVGASAGGGR
jgi:cobalt/nickel transport system permease protein